MKRVVSKNLFNYHPQGKLDEDIKRSLPTFRHVLEFFINTIKYFFYRGISMFSRFSEFEHNEVKVKDQSIIEAGLLTNSWSIEDSFISPDW